MGRIRRMFRQFYQMHRWRLVIFVFICFGGVAFEYYYPQITQQLLDAALKRDSASFWKVFWLECAATLLFIPIMAILEYANNWVDNRAESSQRELLFRDVLRMGFHRLKRNSVGGFLQLTKEDASEVKTLAASSWVFLVAKAGQLAAVLYFLFRADWVLALLILIFSPLYFVSLSAATPMLTKRQSELIAEKEASSNFADSCMQGAEAIRSENAEGFFGKIAALRLKKLLHASDRQAKGELVYETVLSTGLMNVFVSGVIVFAFWRVFQGKMSAGTAHAVNIYFSQLLMCFVSVSNFLMKYNQRQVSLARIEHFHNDADIRDGGTKETLPPFETLSLTGLDFYYEESCIFKNASLKIQKGDKIFIEGANGSGKSTLGRLICMLEQPDSGEFFYNDIPYRDIQPAALRSQLRYIQASPFLIEGSLEDNFFGLALPKEQLFALPDKEIEKDGANLSSGQKKQLQLERCLAADASVYILDEPLNFVDVQAKANIIDIIKNRFQDKTMLIISHDTSLKDMCKRHFIIEGHSIIEK